MKKKSKKESGEDKVREAVNEIDEEDDDDPPMELDEAIGLFRICEQGEYRCAQELEERAGGISEEYIRRCTDRSFMLALIAQLKELTDEVKMLRVNMSRGA